MPAYAEVMQGVLPYSMDGSIPVYYYIKFCKALCHDCMFGHKAKCGHLAEIVQQL